MLSKLTGLAIILFGLATASHAGVINELINGTIVSGNMSGGLNRGTLNASADNSGDAQGENSANQVGAGLGVAQSSGGSGRFNLNVAIGDNAQGGKVTATAKNSGDARNGGTNQVCAGVACSQMN